MIQQIYDILLEKYGPQGWWPYTPKGKTKPHYIKKNWTLKKTRFQRFEIMMGAILAQNTAWKNVSKAMINLKNNGIHSPEDVLACPQLGLAKIIRATGYFNKKSIYLKNFAQFIHENPIEELQLLPLAELRKKILSVKGIGKETADSIILYALQKEIFVIDAYTKRIFSRIGICKDNTKYDHLQTLITGSLEKDFRIYNEFHALLVEHAKRYCRKKPLCRRCILKDMCKSSNQF